MPGPIPIISDIPNSSPGLGFSDYVHALADAIRGAIQPQLTIGLYGAWGSGKSSLLAALAGELDSSEEILVVRFDAWRYERADHIVVPLLYAVSKAGERKRRFVPTVHQLRNFLVSLVGSLNFTTPVGIEVNGAALSNALPEDPMNRLDQIFGRPFEELRVLEGTLKTSRIVILIDDLDRCSPEKVVALLEAINLILDIEGFIFVLALDYEVLVSAVNHKYPHVSGHAFVEKMIQLPFRVPPLSLNSDRLMFQLLPDWETFGLSHGRRVTELIADIATSALKGNPRQIKRLVNYVLLLERIVELRFLSIPTESLAVLIAIQLAWPDEYRALLDRALYSPEDPFESLLTNPDSNVSEFMKRHAPLFDDRDHLARTLQLAQAVDSSAELPGKSLIEAPTAQSRFAGFVEGQNWSLADDHDTNRIRSYLAKSEPGLTQVVFYQSPHTTDVQIGVGPSYIAIYRVSPTEDRRHWSCILRVSIDDARLLEGALASVEYQSLEGLELLAHRLGNTNHVG